MNKMSSKGWKSRPSGREQLLAQLNTDACVKCADNRIAKWNLGLFGFALGKSQIYAPNMMQTCLVTAWMIRGKQ